MTFHQEPCPYCGQPIGEVNWEATIVRHGKVVEGIVVDPDPLEAQFTSVPPGTYTVLPCGHRVDPECGQALMKRMQAANDAR